MPNNLFNKHSLVCKKIVDYSKRDYIFVKWAAFALLSSVALHRKGASDEKFIKFLWLINLEANDNRNYVKKNGELGTEEY